LDLAGKAVRSPPQRRQRIISDRLGLGQSVTCDVGNPTDGDIFCAASSEWEPAKLRGYVELAAQWIRMADDPEA
jgi:hypothetical protein